MVMSCTDPQTSTCAGGSKTGMSVEHMGEVDKYFITTDFSKYIGATLGDFERDLTIKYRERTALTKPPNQLVAFVYAFPDNYSIHIDIPEAKYTTYNSNTGKWDFRKSDKETISHIRVKHVGAGDFYYCKDFGKTD